MKTYLNDTRGLTLEGQKFILGWGQELIDMGIKKPTPFGPVAGINWIVEPKGYIGKLDDQFVNDNE